MTLSLDAIRGADGRKIKEIEVPELDGTIRVRMMSGTDLFRISEYAGKKPNDSEGQARMLFIATIVDDEGKPLFNGQSVSALMDQSSQVVLRLSEEIQEFCGLAGDDEDAVKNSETTPSG